MKKGEGKGKVGQNRSINTINGSHRNPFLTRRIGEEGEKHNRGSGETGALADDGSFPD